MKCKSRLRINAPGKRPASQRILRCRETRGSLWDTACARSETLRSRSAHNASNRNRRIKLFDVETGVSVYVTTDRYDSSSPAWSPDGQWLYLLSERHLESIVSSPWGRMQPEPYFDRKTKIYHIALQTGTRSPFAPACRASGRVPTLPAGSPTRRASPAAPSSTMPSITSTCCAGSSARRSSPSRG